MSPFSLSITFTDIILYSESPIVLFFLGLLFPSAVVQKYNSSDDFPASKITVKKMKVGLRMGLVVRNIDKSNGSIKILAQGTNQVLNFIFQRPIISIKLHGATLHVQKAYIAPPPPPEINISTSLPSAIPSSENIGPEIPVFDQAYLWEFLKDDELRYSDAVTFWVERWGECTN